MTTTELIEYLKQLDPEGNLPVVRYYSGPRSSSLIKEGIYIVSLYEDTSVIPSDYYDEPDDEKDKATPVIYIA